MEDKKISELQSIGAVGLEDVFPIVPIGGETTFKATIQQLKAAIAGEDFGSEVFFSFGEPSAALGRDIDVYYDQTNKGVYQKISGAWVLKFRYETKRSTISFVATEGQTVFQSDYLKGATIKHFFADGLRFKSGYTFNSTTGTITFTTALNLNTEIDIMFV